MFISIVIPTYNRRPILEKCLDALENQSLENIISDYEVIVVDDGSTDGTSSWIRMNRKRFAHVQLLEQNHGGPAEGRNRGVSHSKADIIVFIDSDLVVNKSFLLSHVYSLMTSWNLRGDRLCFTYGTVINTSNFEYPMSEKKKLTDSSWAYFATGNVAIDRKVLLRSGLFDTNFRLYGWEDLELGERLRKMKVKMIKCPKAVGYHWHPALRIDQIKDLIRIEKERAKMGILFFKKHQTLRVRFIIQFTVFHWLLWNFLNLGGLINEYRLIPMLRWLIKKGYSGIAMEILRIPLNRTNVLELFKEARSAQNR